MTLEIKKLEFRLKYLKIDLELSRWRTDFLQREIKLTKEKIEKELEQQRKGLV